MKAVKFFAAAFAAVSISAAFTVNVSAERDVITVKVDNESVEFDQTPIIIGEGYTMVPIRAVFEKAGCDVSWEQDSQTATIARFGYTVTIKYGDNVMYKNGEAVELEAPAIMENNRIMIPVRAIAEAMDYAVTWDGHHSMVLVSTNGAAYRPYAFQMVGFRSLGNAAEVYLTSKGTAVSDLDNDGEDESIEFVPTDDLESRTAPILTINGIDFTGDLGSITSAYSIAVADLAEGDGEKEIVLTENGDVLTAHFYHYSNGIFTRIPVMYDGKAVEFHYTGNMFISGKGRNNGADDSTLGYMLSDLNGACFTDIMVTGGVYVYQNSEITLRRMTDLSPIYYRNLYNSYNDIMLYHVIYTDDYKPGGYKDITDTGVISSVDIERFVIMDGYIDESDPTYIELYIQLPNGVNAVIKPYQA